MATGLAQLRAFIATVAAIGTDGYTGRAFLTVLTKTGRAIAAHRPAIETDCHTCITTLAIKTEAFGALGAVLATLRANVSAV